MVILSKYGLGLSSVLLKTFNAADLKLLLPKKLDVSQFTPEMRDIVLYNLNVPLKLNYSTVIAANTAEVGLLHILLRHPNLLKAKFPMLPPALAQLADDIRRSWKTQKRQRAFDKILSNESDELFKSAHDASIDALEELEKLFFDSSYSTQAKLMKQKFG
uniref:Uncharacterized protein n=1 Tax=Panagrolaimus sp. JU765 TaxID=591449 RepID=A0AC34RNA0_9BILA